MDGTTYYLWSGVRLPEEYDTEAAAVAAAQDGQQVYRETISGTFHERARVWPTPTETQHWSTHPRIYHD